MKIKEENGKFYCNFRYKGDFIRLSAKTELELISKIEKKQKKIDYYIKFPELKQKRGRKEKISKVFNKVCEVKRYNKETLRKKRIIFDRYILSYFTEDDILKITPISLKKWYDEVYDAYLSGRFQDNRFNRIISVMQDIIKFAIEERIPILPSIKLSLIPKIKEKKVVSQKLEENYITEEELILFLDEVKELDDIHFRVIEKDYFIFMCEFLFYTGARINEARGVKRSDFYEDRSGKVGYITIKRQLEDYKNNVMPSLKNGASERKTYLKSDIFRRFISFLDEKEVKDNDFIFMDKRFNLVITRKKLSDTLSKIIKLLKKDKKLPDTFPDVLTPHGFRYSNTLYLKRLGVSIELAARMQGHTVSVMLNTYTRVDKSEIENIFG